VPVLLIHGEKDERAPISHAKKLCAAMQAARKSCEELYVPNEYHGFFDVANALNAYNRALDFIEKHTK
jgi:dipeptidyl aminopeptidase/acylaminoacyl peptidase